MGQLMTAGRQVPMLAEAGDGKPGPDRSTIRPCAIGRSEALVDSLLNKWDSSDLADSSGMLAVANPDKSNWKKAAASKWTTMRNTKPSKRLNPNVLARTAKTRTKKPEYSTPPGRFSGTGRQRIEAGKVDRLAQRAGWSVHFCRPGQQPPRQRQRKREIITARLLARAHIG